MKKNLIFVLIDGARVDRLSESTEFNEIAKDGFLFDDVTTAFPYTVGAVNSIFTGHYGKENGVDGYYKVLDLKKTATTITEILKKNGNDGQRGIALCRGPQNIFDLARV